MAIPVSESLVVGFSDFWSRKIRSAVTIFGILLGTMSIIVVLSLVKGVNKSTLDWMEQRGGIKKISVRRNWQYKKQNKVRRYFTYPEIRLIKSLLPEINTFNPKLRQFYRLTKGSKEFWGGVNGVFPDFLNMEKWDVAQGRFINDYDLSESNDIIIIGSTVKRELFGNKKAIGEYILVHNRRMRIVGVMAERIFYNSSNAVKDNQMEYMNRRSFIPLSTLINKISRNSYVDAFDLMPNTVAEVKPTQAKLKDILASLRKNEPVFRVDSGLDNSNEYKTNEKLFKIIFGMISCISLFVGGIVIMNIMLATIQERTREIGVRLAVGARRRDIFIQFIVQTVLITTIGGILGVATGLSILDLISKFIQIEAIADFSMVVIAVTISAGVGLIFGIIPAIHASNLDPVKALRYE